MSQTEAEQRERLPGLTRRLAEQADRVRAQSEQLDALRAALASNLQEIAVAALSDQQQRMVEYTLQARLALAQLYDRAYKDTLNQGAPRATSP